MAHRSQMRGALQLATLLGQMLSVSGALYVLGALALVNHGHDGDDGDGQPWDAVWRALWVVGSPALILLLTVSVFETLVLQVDCLPPLVFVKFQAVKLLIMMVDAVAVGVLFYLHHDQTSLPDGWEYRVIAGWGFLMYVPPTCP